MTPLHDMREHGDGWHVCTRCGRSVLVSGTTMTVYAVGNGACNDRETPAHVAREGERLLARQLGMEDRN